APGNGCAPPPSGAAPTLTLPVSGGLELHSVSGSHEALTPTLPDGFYAVPPGTARVLALVAQTTDTCAVGSAQPYTYLDADGSPVTTTLHPTDGFAACGLAETAGDTAVCNEQPGAYQCQRRAYAAPVVVDRVTLDNSGAATTALTLSTRLPGFSQVTTRQHILAASWSSKATALPPTSAVAP
ncbi:MAG: hypothetical protein ACI9WU_005370, partial [Myxococcota bacterium]